MYKKNSTDNNDTTIYNNLALHDLEESINIMHTSSKQNSTLEDRIKIFDSYSQDNNIKKIHDDPLLHINFLVKQTLSIQQKKTKKSGCFSKCMPISTKILALPAGALGTIVFFRPGMISGYDFYQTVLLGTNAFYKEFWGYLFAISNLVSRGSLTMEKYLKLSDFFRKYFHFDCKHIKENIIFLSVFSITLVLSISPVFPWGYTAILNAKSIPEMILNTLSAMVRLPVYAMPIINTGIDLKDWFSNIHKTRHAIEMGILHQLLKTLNVKKLEKYIHRMAANGYFANINSLYKKMYPTNGRIGKVDRRFLDALRIIALDLDYPHTTKFAMMMKYVLGIISVLSAIGGHLQFINIFQEGLKSLKFLPNPWDILIAQTGWVFLLCFAPLFIKGSNAFVDTLYQSYRDDPAHIFMLKCIAIGIFGLISVPAALAYLNIIKSAADTSIFADLPLIKILLETTGVVGSIFIHLSGLYITCAGYASPMLDWVLRNSEKIGDAGCGFLWKKNKLKNKKKILLINNDEHDNDDGEIDTLLKKMTKEEQEEKIVKILKQIPLERIEQIFPEEKKEEKNALFCCGIFGARKTLKFNQNMEKQDEHDSNNVYLQDQSIGDEEITKKFCCIPKNKSGCTIL